MEKKALSDMIKSEAILDKIGKYCVEDIKKRWEAVIRKMSADEINIVNTGLVSSGKSSLYNVLVNQYSEERFPTGAARTTLSQDKELFVNGVYLVDTPGIDVKEEDDEKAFSALLEADIIVFVHNIKLGELRREEVEWISRINKNIPADELKKRFICVCSWIDERDSDAEYPDTVNKIKKMVADITGTEIDFYFVSTKRYITGKEKQSKILMEKSNIPVFRDALENKARLYAKTNNTAECTLNAVCDESIEYLLKRKATLILKSNKIKREIENKYSPKLKTWENIFKQYLMKKEKIVSIKNEIKYSSGG